MKDRVSDDLLDVHAVAARQPLERGLHPRGRLPESLALGILPELLEHLVDDGLEGNAHRSRLRMGLVEAVQARGLYLISRHTHVPS